MGSDALSNAEVLAHLNEIESEWARDDRLRVVPMNAQKAVQNVRILCIGLAASIQVT